MLTSITRRLNLLGLFLAAVLALQAQTGNGSIVGTVRDASGAVVPTAQVTLTHTATAETFSATTNGAGLYVFPSLVAGSYEILISAKGMQDWKAQLTVLAMQRAEVEATLTIGLASTVVEVKGDVAPLVATTNGTLSTVLERERVEELPLNGRMFYSLIAQTTPGLQNVGSSTQTVWGVRYATEYSQDGSLLQDKYLQGMVDRPPALESVDELVATTNAASAKLSRPAVITMSTRAGTNLIHGSLFETNRDNGYGLARTRTQTFTKAPQLVRNEFGGSFGGPVYIPKLYNGKNKTFFFFTHEGRRVFQGSSTQIAVPTAAMRQGDFSNLTDSTSHVNTLYDPASTGPAPTYSRTPFPNNQIPVTRESPTAKALWAITPMPTLPSVNPLAGYNYSAATPDRDREYTYTMRFDHRFSDKDHVFARYTRSEYGETVPGNNANDGSPTTTDGQINNEIVLEHHHSGVISLVHTFSPTLFSETVATYQNDYNGTNAVDMTDLGVAASLGLPNPFGGGGAPYVSAAGNSSVNWMSYSSPVVTLTQTKSFSLDENFTKVHGRHELLFGVRIRQDLMDQLPNQQAAAGAETYSSLATSAYDPSTGSSYGALPYTGNNTANMFLGVVGSYTAQFNRSWFRFKGAERSGYFQDNFKVNDRLTVNMGLRYEYFVPFQVRDGGIFGFDPSSLSVVLGNSIDYLTSAHYTVPSVVNALQTMGMTFETNSQLGLPTTMIHNYAKNFGPRAGLAYKVTRGNKPLVIRAGYALYAYPESLRTATSDLRSATPGIGSFTLNENSAAQSPDGLANYYLRHAPDIIAGVNSSNVVNINSPNALARGTPGMYYFNPNSPTDRSSTWNATFEKAIGMQTMVSAGYVGTHAFNLGQYVSINDSPSNWTWYTETGQSLPSGTYSGVAQRPLYSTTGPGSVWGSIQRIDKIGWENQNGLQLQIMHRFSKGLSFQAFYTLMNIMRAGGNGWSDDTIQDSPNYYVPSMKAAQLIKSGDLNALDRLEFYARDVAYPKHQIQYNWLYSIPVGRGKHFGSNMNKILDGVVGGWQFAGSGAITSTYVTVSTSYFGTFGTIHRYGTQYATMDCRSGLCQRGYLWWNGYIPSTQISSAPLNQCPKGFICGVPSSYTPAIAPIITDPTDKYYNTNDVLVNVNGTPTIVAYNNSMNPYQNQYLLGPFEWGVNGSLWKQFTLHERAKLQFHLDAFNALNHPGNAVPSGTDGTQSLASSYFSARQLQLTLRLVW